ncbi:hypothetical protein KCP75_15300 [Salmonella enterica subsp. enterica]|nr:hypothetical protein KCP75_15300 [Salmonella enterica subsp. enterica]
MRKMCELRFREPRLPPVVPLSNCAVLKDPRAGDPEALLAKQHGEMAWS